MFNKQTVRDLVEAHNRAIDNADYADERESTATYNSILWRDSAQYWKGVQHGIEFALALIRPADKIKTGFIFRRYKEDFRKGEEIHRRQGILTVDDLITDITKESSL